MKIYHNPRCTKSRETLALLNEANVTVEIVEYLKEIPTTEELKEILSKLQLAPIDLVRKGEAIYKESYKGKELTDDEWIQAMIENPKLIERPIVVKGDKAIIGRPPESVKTLL